MTPFFGISITFPIVCIVLSHAILLSSSTIRSNGTLLGPSVNAPIPPAPPGFKLKRDFLETTPVDPIGVYLTIIAAMATFGMQPWSAEFDLDGIYSIPSLGDRVILSTFKKSPRLQPGHVILALYDSIYEMYSRRPGFCVLTCGITLQEESVGWIFITTGPGGSVLSGGQQDTIVQPKGIEGGVSLVNSTSSLTADSGVVVDPEDPGFRISWDSNGRSVPAQEILSAGIDGLATTAQYDYNGPCSHVTGVSFSGKVGFHIGQSHGSTLSCSQMSRAFSSLMVRVIVRNRGFQEMDFTLKYDGAQVGTGYIMKI